MSRNNPFVGTGPQEVHLADAPLVKVLCQIRFPTIASVDKKEFIAPFQEAIRHSYPKLIKDQGVELSFGPQGGSFPTKVIWRMLDKSMKWRISVGENFLSLDTSEYPGREIFIKALQEIIDKMQTIIRPDLVERIGLRYINKVLFNNIEQLASWLHPGVLGIVNEQLDENLSISLTETKFSFSEGMNLTGKWGLLPAGQSYDPTILDPVERRSWILDIDGFSEASLDFDVEAILSRLDRLADIDYRFFRFIVTDSFLKEYGGTL
jgi:uncharacterized protein (TIGR04255 family)